MKKYVLIAVALLLLVGCSALKVETDYNEEFNFKKLSKFTVMYSKKDDGKDFARSGISRALANHFKDIGYLSTAKERADFYVVFHLNVEKKSQVETNYETMGYYPVGGHRGLARPGIPPNYIGDPYRGYDRRSNTRVTTNTYEYKEGKLIVELIDVKSDSVFWQGIAKDELSDLATKEAKSAYINMVIEELLKDFPTK